MARRYKSYLTSTAFIIVAFLIFMIAFSGNFSDDLHGPDAQILGSINSGTYAHSDGYYPRMDSACERVADSVRKVQEFQKLQLQGMYSGFTSFIGLVTARECDTCTSVASFFSDDESTKKYYLRLAGYSLRNGCSFFIKKGKYYVTTSVVRRTSINENSWTEEETNKKTTQVQVRYSTDLNDVSRKSNPEVNRALLIPIAPQNYIYYQIVYYSLMAVLLLSSLTIVLIFPINILYNIAQGRPFTRKNILQMDIMGWCLLGFAVLSPLLTASFQLFSHDLIPYGFYFPLWQIMQGNKYIILAALVILLISNAFKSGYKLQQEQDLTV